MDCTLPDLLARRARETPHELGIRFRTGPGWDDLTWLEYDRLVEGTARALLEAGIRPGEHVLVLEIDPMRAVPILLGLWRIGAIPSNLGLPPSPSGIEGYLRFVVSVAGDWSVRRLLVADALSPMLAGLAGRIEILRTGDLVRSAPDEKSIGIPASHVGLIQLSSGSSARPKGIVISHRNLLAHLGEISNALPAPPNARGVTWLPLYHDMGLIGGLLYPLFTGFPVAVMSPLDFKLEPLAWFRAASELQATITCAPPSAVSAMIRLASAALAEGIRLDPLATFMIGAEPISPRVLEEFADAFESCGFSASAFFPVYGLAEVTVAATFPVPGKGATELRVSREGLRTSAVREPSSPEDAERLTGLGTPIGGVEIGIRSERGEPLPADRVGEVWVRTETGMDGYYLDEVATGAAYRDGWLLTGDLGFLRGGQLYVVGRSKDVIIKAGQNISPVSIEEAVSCVEGIRRGAVVAVGIDSEKRATQKLFIVAETKLPASEHRDLRRRIVAAAKTRGVVPDGVIIAAPGTIPKTTSGKVRRIQVQQDIAAGILS